MSGIQIFFITVAIVKAQKQSTCLEGK